MTNRKDVCCKPCRILFMVLLLFSSSIELRAQILEDTLTSAFTLKDEYKIEQRFIDIVNEIRTNPLLVIPALNQYKAYILREGAYSMDSNEIKESLTIIDEEVVPFLSRAKPQNKLSYLKSIRRNLNRHRGVDMKRQRVWRHDSELFKKFKYQTQGENISEVWCSFPLLYTVFDLLIDAGVPSRGHRVNLFSPKYSTTAVRLIAFGDINDPDSRVAYIQDFKE